ncbi:snaclec stejaggregin-A subunit alpha-like [Diadema setosum]|uniref:snaclec stejaggregin-A subunit alpha-like n=1 Tax=Diadema setosum TaxID=31175 RepID=UPI003B3A37DB
MVLREYLIVSLTLLICCGSALCRTEQINKDAASALYTLAETCSYFNCPSGWPARAPGRQSCYIYRSDSKTWTSARDTCSGLGGHLLSLDSLTEMATVRDFLKSEYGKSSTPWVWTGLNDRSKEGQYKWTGFGGSLSKSSNMWNSGEPNNHKDWWGPDEDCGEFNGYKLNDLNCDEKRPFICEFIPQ